MSESVATSTYESNNHNKHTETNWLYRKHLEGFYSELIDAIGRTECDSLLDAGCGEGFVLDAVAKEYPDMRLSGIDVSEKAIEYAKSHFGDRARFRPGSVYKLPFSDKSFDTVLCSEVLEHLEDPNRAIEELKRVARKYVIISVPHEPYFRWLNKLGRLVGVAEDPGHVNFWTSTTFPAFIRAHFDNPEFIWKQLYQIAVAPVK
ncbi:MAG: class I SAM-dependent methyltransferase [Rhodothermales bacterium]